MLQETVTALSANKARSGLTVLGIVIGISSVIAMISVGQGASSGITSSIQSLGSNLIVVTPGAQRTAGFGASAGRGSATSLTEADAEAIAHSVQGITASAVEVSSRQQITAKGTNTNTSVVGVTPSYAAVRNVDMQEGTFITDSQNATLAKVAVLGPTVVQDLFGDPNSTDIPSVVGVKIRIKGMEFKVIGVTAAKGGNGFGSQDDTVYIPAVSAQRFLTGGESITALDIEAASPDGMTQVQSDLTDLLLKRHNIDDPTKADFTVLNQNDLLSTVSTVTQTLTILLASIAGISLVVGGIGIMNMMLTTVTERTREIGLRKAIGAKRNDISRQFLAEAIVLTLIGGGIGVALGIGIALGINSLGLIKAVISWKAILLAFGVSAGIGIIFGWYPARRAASLSPIDALRYE